MMSEAQPTKETAAIAEVIGDPLNRFYRYRVATWMLPLFMRTPLTPNGVTYLHMAVGLVAAVCVAQGSDAGLIVAFFLSELRLILDCVDGALARAKKISSPYGRTLDELGDGVCWVSLCIGMFIHIHAKDPSFPAASMLVVLIVLGGIMGWSHDFYKRKFTSALKSGSDSIYDEMLVKELTVRAGGAGFVTKFGLWFDWMQVKILAPSMRREMEARIDEGLRGNPMRITPDVQYILKSAHSKNFKFVLRALSLMSGDNAISLATVGLLTGNLVATQMFVLVYGVFTLGSGVLVANLFMHGARRELAGSLPPAE